MANPLENFIETNKAKLTEINNGNPQLYSALTNALNYLNTNYFGGTNTLSVELPKETPVQTIKTDSLDRIFTHDELAEHIKDNVWTALDFKEIKIELENYIQQQNFVNLIKQLLEDRDTYVTRGNIGNYFYTDEDLVVGNNDDERSFRQSPYQLLYYNQIFENLLKTQQTATKLPSVWDSVYAYSSKDYATPIDYNFLQKAIYSKRRSKEMKLEIARAFGTIKSISKAVATNWDEVEKNYGKSETNFIYRYELNDEVFKIIEDRGFDFSNITQYTDLEIKEWISELIFYEFEKPLQLDDIKEKLLEWYRNQVNKPTNQTHTPTPQPNEFKPIWRFKTEQEFIDEYGANWKEDTNWNLLGDMDYLLGRPISNPMFDLNFSVESFDTSKDLGIDSGRQNTWYLRPIYFRKIENDQESKPTPQASTFRNAKFKIGDKVQITNLGKRYTTFRAMFKKMGFANQFENDEGSNGDVGTIFGVDVDTKGRIIYGVYVELGATRKYQILITEEGIELFQPTPLSASKIEVGDWVRVIDDSKLANGIKNGFLAEVELVDDTDAFVVNWLNPDYISEYGNYDQKIFELALKQPKPTFKIGDAVKWKEEVPTYNAKEGAVGIVYGFYVYDDNIMVDINWIDTKQNLKLVNGQANGGYPENFFTILATNEDLEKTAKTIANEIKSNAPITEQHQSPEDDVSFNKLADELEDLDF